MRISSLAALFYVVPFATSTVALAQETSAGTSQPLIVNDQMKQLGEQVLISLFERLVQGRPNPATVTAPVDDAAHVAETPVEPEMPAEPVVESAAPVAEPEDVPPQPAFIKQSKRTTKLQRSRTK